MGILKEELYQVLPLGSILCLLFLTILLFFLIVLAIVLELHILETKLFLLLVCTSIALTVNCGVRGRGVNERLNIAAREGVGKDDGKSLLTPDGGIKTIEEGSPFGLLVAGKGVTTLANALEDLGVKITTDLSLALEDITAQIGAGLDIKDDLLALLGDLTTSLDIVGAVATVVANGRHEDDLLEVGNINHLHMSGAGAHAARACCGEAVNLIGDDIAIGSQARVQCFPSVGIGIGDTKSGVLLRSSGILVLLPLTNTILKIGCDEGVASRVIEPDTEGERLAVQHGATLGDDFGNLGVKLRNLLLSRLLSHLEIINDSSQKALNVCELATTGRNLKIQLDELDGGSIRLDNLSREVGKVCQAQFVVCSLGLEATGRLDFVVLEVAVFAGEGHDNDLAEVGDHSKKKSGHTLNPFRLNLLNGALVVGIFDTFSSRRKVLDLVADGLEELIGSQLVNFVAKAETDT
ncbi:hypothetical protein HG530_011177 [Fusarium avenaceum]|nr:hypothetical protein HG530_011177 [Fusarium avenaceum]